MFSCPGARPRSRTPEQVGGLRAGGYEVDERASDDDDWEPKTSLLLCVAPAVRRARRADRAFASNQSGYGGGPSTGVLGSQLPAGHEMAPGWALESVAGRYCSRKS